MLRFFILHPMIRGDSLNPYEIDVSIRIIRLFEACTQSGSQHCPSIMSNLLFLPRSPQISSAKNQQLICHQGCAAPFQSVHLR